MGLPPIGGSLFDDPNNFKKLIEILDASVREIKMDDLQDEASTDIEAFDEDCEVFDDLAPRSLEELSKLLLSAYDAHQRRRLAEAAMTRMAVALCALASVGAGVFVATGSLAVLIAILTFFTAMFSRILKGR